MKYIFPLIACIGLLCIFMSSCVKNSLHEVNVAELNQIENWCIYLHYDEDEQTSVDWNHSQMVIVDPDFHPLLPKKDTYLIAYISVGEAEDYRDYWDEVKDQSFVLKENENWKGNYLVDIRSPEWQGILVNQVIPSVISKGFDGLFLDTLDAALQLEHADLKVREESRKSLISLIGVIHRKYPQLKLISNNGHEILEEIAPFLSGFLVEDLHGMYDFASLDYIKVDEAVRLEKIEQLKKMKAQHYVAVFVVDYADISNARARKFYRESSKALGFKPYIAEINLDQVYPQ